MFDKRIIGIFIVLILVLVVILFLFFNVFYTQLDKKYQLIYYLNNKEFESGSKRLDFNFKNEDKNELVDDTMPKQANNSENLNCPRGCYKKKCILNTNCYNCYGDDPYCCCYDSQCAKC